MMRLPRVARMPAIVGVLCLLCCCAFAGPNDDQGYLDRPPVYVTNGPDMPLDLMGHFVPERGIVVRYVDIDSLTSSEFRTAGANVQPALTVDMTTYRASVLRGFGGGWAAGLSLPWRRTWVGGRIGGQPAPGVADGIGDLALFGKRLLWKDEEGRSLSATVGMELPTGKDDAASEVANAATGGYYSSQSARMPLGWQPGSGSVDLFLALGYGRQFERASWDLTAAAKLHGRGDEDVSLGSIFAIAASGTYGLTRDVAASLALAVRTQSDDDYPQAPPPGVNSPLLAGTTQHGTAVWVEPALHWRIGPVVVGVGYAYPIAKPDDGMTPRADLSLSLRPARF